MQLTVATGERKKTVFLRISFIYYFRLKTVEFKFVKLNFAGKVHTINSITYVQDCQLNSKAALKKLFSGRQIQV